MHELRRSLAAGIWLIMTVTATFIVWEAVSVVAADVTDRPAPVVAHHDVVVALQAGSSQAATTTTTAPTSTTAPRVPPTTHPASPPTTTAVGGAGGSPGGPSFLPVTTTTVPASPPTTKAPGHPVPTTLAPPTGATATYSTDGGVIGVGCTGFDTVRLIAALPYDGYQALVISSNGFFVQVNFIGQGRNIGIGAGCIFNQPFPINEQHQ